MKDLNKIYKLTLTGVRNACVKNDFFNMGDNEAYDALLNNLSTTDIGDVISTIYFNTYDSTYQQVYIAITSLIDEPKSRHERIEELRADLEQKGCTIKIDDYITIFTANSSVLAKYRNDFDCTDGTPKIVEKKILHYLDICPRVVLS